MIDTVTLPPTTAVIGLVNSHLGARAVHVAAEVGLADALGADEVLDADTIAARIGCDPGAVGRLLRALHAHGLFTRNGGGWQHNEASRVLRSGHPQSVRDYARMFASPLMWGCITELGHSVRTGDPAANLFDPNGTWAYLAAHPDEAAIFNTAMTAKSHADAAEVIESTDLTDAGTVVDIGGGRGQLLHAILDASPSATGILFDLPAVTAQAIPRNDNRLQVHPGDFFTDPIPPYDTAVVMTVIHDWPDDKAIAILRAARAAARPTSRLLIIDSVIDNDTPTTFVTDLDIAMLAITGGLERTTHELADLLTASGFTRTATTPLPSGRAITQAQPV